MKSAPNRIEMQWGMRADETKDKPLLSGILAGKCMQICETCRKLNFLDNVKFQSQGRRRHLKQTRKLKNRITAKWEKWHKAEFIASWRHQEFVNFYWVLHGYANFYHWVLHDTNILPDLHMCKQQNYPMILDARSISKSALCQHTKNKNKKKKRRNLNDLHNILFEKDKHKENLNWHGVRSGWKRKRNA